MKYLLKLNQKKIKSQPSKNQRERKIFCAGYKRRGRMIDLYTVECTLNKIKIKKKYSRRTSKGRPGVQVL